MPNTFARILGVALSSALVSAQRRTHGYKTRPVVRKPGVAQAAKHDNHAQRTPIEPTQGWRLSETNPNGLLASAAGWRYSPLSN